MSSILSEECTSPSEPSELIVTFNSSAHTTLTGFAKSKSWSKDLFESLIAPTFDTDLRTMTWQNYSNALPSIAAGKTCAEYSFGNSNSEEIALLSKHNCGTCVASGQSCLYPPSRYNYSVENVSGVYMTEETNWLNKQDHSKWAISSRAANPIVCFADINRILENTKRAGGALCLKNKSLWNAFDKIIDPDGTP